MGPYRYEKKIKQCEILLAHTGSIITLQAPPPSLVESLRSPVQSAQDISHNVPTGRPNVS